MCITKKNRQTAGLPWFFAAWNLVFQVCWKFEVNSLSTYWYVTVSSRGTDISNLNAYYFLRFLHNINCTGCFLTKFCPNTVLFIMIMFLHFFLNDDFIINFGWIMMSRWHHFQKWRHFSKKFRDERLISSIKTYWCFADKRRSHCSVWSYCSALFLNVCVCVWKYSYSLHAYF